MNRPHSTSDVQLSMLSLVTCAVLLLAPLGFAHADEWYVRADTRGNDASFPLGSRDNPFGSLAEVEAVSEAGDTIFVVQSPSSVPPLDGGIHLKERQSLIGLGPDARNVSLSAATARITNSSGYRYSGDAVRLADDARVERLHIVQACRGAIFGLNTSGVEITDNLITRFNRDCLRDEPSNPLDVGTEVAGIHLVGNGAAVLEESEIKGNVIRGVQDPSDPLELRTGPHGISILLSDQAVATYELNGNTITDIANWQTSPTSPYGSAVQVFTLDDATAAVTIGSLFVDRIGHGIDGMSDPWSNSDKIRVVMEDRSQLDLTVCDYVARNSTGVGGSSSAGIEMALGWITGPGNGMRLETLIENADIRDMPSAGVQLVDGGYSADVSLTVLNTVVSGTSGWQGHSIIDYTEKHWSGSGMGRHTIRLENNDLRNSERGSVTVFVAENATSDSLDVVIKDNVMANAVDGLYVWNEGHIGSLTLSAEGNDMLGSQDWGLLMVDAGAIATSSIDLGGGVLGSNGQNRIVGSGLGEALIYAMTVVAKYNWWGSAQGPRLELLNGGSLDFEPFLTAQPGGPLPPFNVP